jgi:hypothetical protein
MRLLIFKGCFDPIQCPYIYTSSNYPYVLHSCRHPKIKKECMNMQIPSFGFPYFCELCKIIEENNEDKNVKKKNE